MLSVYFYPFACNKFYKPKFKIIYLSIHIRIHIHVYKNKAEGNFIYHH